MGDLKESLDGVNPELLQEVYERTGKLLERNSSIGAGLKGIRALIASYIGVEEQAKAASEVVPKVFDNIIEDSDEANDSLTDKITIAYHERRRQEPLEISGLTIEDDVIYSMEDASKVLGLGIPSIGTMMGKSQGKLYGEGEPKKLSGYEIIRYHFKPRSNSNYKKSEIAELFNLTDSDIRMLIKLGRLQTNQHGLITGRYVSKLYDQIFPIKGSSDGYTDRYVHVMRLLGKDVSAPGEVTYTAETSGDGSERRGGVRRVEVAPIIPPDSLEKAAAVETTEEASSGSIEGTVSETEPKERVWVNLKQLGHELKKGTHYSLIQDKDEPRPDAFYIRSKEEGTVRKGNRRMKIDHGDMMRLYHALEYKKAGVSKLEGFDREMALVALEIAGIPPILYKGDFIFPPGTIDILTLGDDDLKTIADVARPLIEEHGPFISLKEIKGIFRRNFILPEHPTLSKTTAEIQSKVESINIDGPIYNLFQVAMLYKDVLSPPG